MAVTLLGVTVSDCRTASDFKCATNLCLPKSVTCDGYDQCGDRSDENKLCGAFLANVNSCSCSLYVVVGPSVVCRLSSVTLVHPTQAIEIFGNVSTPFGTLTICDPPVKILRRSSQGNPSVEG